MTVGSGGSGFFGAGRWGRRILWENVPVQHRTLDAAYGNVVEDMLGAWGDEMETFLQQIAEIPMQRDPFLARATSGQGEYFYVTQVLPYDSPTWGKVFRIIGERDYSLMPNTGDLAWEPVVEPVWYPYQPISKIARWWTARLVPARWDYQGGTIGTDPGIAMAPVEYEVALVRTRNFDPRPPLSTDDMLRTESLANEVWVRGADLSLLNLPFVVDDALYPATAASLKVGVGDGSTAPPVALPGLQARLQANVQDPPGPPWATANARLHLVVPLQLPAMTLHLYDVPDAITPWPETGNLYPEAAGVINVAVSAGTVNYLTGEIVLTLPGDSQIGAEIQAYRTVRGYYLPFLPPRVLDKLALDYGFENDRNDPEDRQRAAIAHLTKFFGCKGAQDAYRIRGEISLFDVYVRALYRVCDATLAASLPADHVWTYGGLFYTDLNPRTIRFDDIAVNELYYDTFNHETPFPAPPEWLALADRALIYPDDTAADGMSAAMAYALDVTQGYYAPVSEVNAAHRAQATVTSSTLLSSTDAYNLYHLAAAYEVVVRMQRCQADAFTFLKGRFGLTMYDFGGGVPPAPTDTVYWIDSEKTAWTFTGAGVTPEEDVGDWTIIVGVGLDPVTGLPEAGPPVGEDTAVRYWPEVASGDCCFCRSYKVRVEIEPTAAAVAQYPTAAEMNGAIARLKSKIAAQLIPIHVRVAEWEVTTEFTIPLYGIYQSVAGTLRLPGGEFADLGVLGQVLATVQQRGDLNGGGETQQITITADGVLVMDTGAVQSGFADPATWYDVAGFAPIDLTAVLGTATDVDLGAVAAAGVTYGDVQIVFTVIRSEQP